MVPTHFICCICNSEFSITVNKKQFYTCKKCNQKYELVPTKFGVANVLVGNKKLADSEGGAKDEANKNH